MYYSTLRVVVTEEIDVFLQARLKAIAKPALLYKALDFFSKSVIKNVDLLFANAV